MACNRASDCCHIGFKPRCATSDAGSPPDWPPSKRAQIRFRNRGGDHRILDAARCFLNNLRRPLLACAVQRRRFPVGANPIRQPLQPEAIGAVMQRFIAQQAIARTNGRPAAATQPTPRSRRSMAVANRSSEKVPKKLEAGPIRRFRHENISGKTGPPRKQVGRDRGEDKNKTTLVLARARGGLPPDPI
jgi:hypothetical protein